MSASFRRRKAAGSSQSSSTASGRKGTKAWAGGSTLTSSGLRDLDAILGGGQPLGTCVLVEEDQWVEDLASCLIKYWCTEALCQHQMLLVPSSTKHELAATEPPPLTEETQVNKSTLGCSRSEITELLETLPRDLHLDKATTAGVSDESKSLPLEILEENDKETEDGDAEAGLTIAWQYRKSVQSARMGQTGTTSTASTSSDVFCHSFDLSGRLKDQNELILTTQVKLVKCDCCVSARGCQESRSCGMRLFRQLAAHISEATASGSSVVRLFLHRIRPETMKISLPLLLAHIRTRRLPVVVLVTMQPWTSSEADLDSVRRCSDVVLQTEGFVSRASYPPPHEFQHLTGLLLVPKVSTVTLATANGGGGHFADMTVSKRPPSHVYGLKRDRRKLHIPLLHIPPEDYACGDGSVQGGGVRSGAGRGSTDKKPIEVISSGSTSSNSLLDF